MLAARRIEDGHPEAAARLVDHHLVDGDRAPLVVEALGLDHLLGGELGEPYLGGEGGGGADELLLAVDREDHLDDALAGGEGLGPPEAEDDVGVGRQEGQAVGAGADRRGERLAGRRGARRGGRRDGLSGHLEAARQARLGAAP